MEEVTAYSGEGNAVSKQPRCKWADTAKAIGIFLIVLGHCPIQSSFSKYLYAFHVPLFFLLSALFLKTDRPMGAVAKQKFRQLMLPYYFAAIPSILVFQILGKFAAVSLNKSVEADQLSLWHNIFGMLYANSRNGLMQWNNPLYFLPCLFACILLVSFVERQFVKDSQLRRLTALVLFSVIGCSISVFAGNLILPLNFEIAVNMAVWMELILAIRPALRRLDVDAVTVGWKKYGLLLSAAVFAGIGALLDSYNGTVSIRSNIYSIYPLYQMVVLFASSAMILIAIVLRNCSILEYIGKHTLIILMFHKFPILFFTAILPATKEIIRSGTPGMKILCNLSISLAAILLCLALGAILNRIFRPHSR